MPAQATVLYASVHIRLDPLYLPCRSGDGFGMSVPCSPPRRDSYCTVLYVQATERRLEALVPRSAALALRLELSTPAALSKLTVVLISGVRHH